MSLPYWAFLIKITSFRSNPGKIRHSSRASRRSWIRSTATLGMLTSGPWPTRTSATAISFTRATTWTASGTASKSTLQSMKPQWRPKSSTLATSPWSPSRGCSLCGLNSATCPCRPSTPTLRVNWLLHKWLHSKEVTKCHLLCPLEVSVFSKWKSF